MSSDTAQCFPSTITVVCLCHSVIKYSRFPKIETSIPSENNAQIYIVIRNPMSDQWIKIVLQKSYLTGVYCTLFIASEAGSGLVVYLVASDST